MAAAEEFVTKEDLLKKFKTAFPGIFDFVNASEFHMSSYNFPEDTVLWVLIFAIAAGLGSEAAVLGMLFHSIAYLVKAISEAFEEVDKGILEALTATVANWWHIVTHAVLPSTFTYLLSWTFLRFEINFSVAVAMGAAAGAGGIGFELFMASGFYFDMREVGLITYMILILAIVLELTSTKLKSRYFPATSTN